jgi:hypothetical protein
MQQVIQQAMQQKGYTVFTHPFQLNIVGIRSPNSQANNFDDTINVMYKTDSVNWLVHSFKATTHPGLYWLINPSNPAGTAILKPGQYSNSHCIGLHRGKYTALIQQNPVTVIRDNNADAALDYKSVNQQTGLFGINIHHAASGASTKTVDKYSAGCQVFANPHDFAFFIQLAQLNKSLYGNNFTYTLLQAQKGLGFQ